MHGLLRGSGWIGGSRARASGSGDLRASAYGVGAAVGRVGR